MKRIIFYLLLSIGVLKAQGLNITVAPDTFTVGDTLTLSITSTSPVDGYVYLSVGGMSQVISPNQVILTNGVFQGNAWIYKAGYDSARGVFPDSSWIDYSNPFMAYPLSPSRTLILVPGQGNRPGDMQNKGREPISPPFYYSGDVVDIRIFLTDTFYNPVSGNLTLQLTTNDSVTPNLPSNINLTDIDTTSVELRIATEPPQFGVSDARYFYTLPQDTLFSGDTSSPYMIVRAGNYTKVLLIAPGERHYPGDPVSGKRGSIDTLASGIPFSLRALACDNYFNRNGGISNPVVLSIRDRSGNPIISDTGNFNQGDITFSVTISGAGTYFANALDITTGFQSGDVVLDIWGNHYVDTLFPDTIVSGVEPCTLKLWYYDALDNLVPSSHYVDIQALLASNRQPATGTLSQTRVWMEEGSFEGTVYYTTNQTERIVLRITDSLGSVPHETKDILVLYLPAIPETLVNYPNPFGNINDDKTIIKFWLPKSGQVRLWIYDLFGNPVRKWSINGQGGENQIIWDGTNDKNKRVASGTYIAILKASSGAEEILSTKRLIAVVW